MLTKKNTQLEIKIQGEPSTFNTYQLALVSCKCRWTYANPTSR